VVVETCASALWAVREQVLAAGRSDRVVALAVAAPGPLDSRAGVFLDPPNLVPAFRGFALATEVGEALGLPAVLERDTHVAALAERAFGAARGVDDFLYLTVSTGCGGAIVSRGELLTGVDGTAGELGHLPVELDGPLCGCGGRGHLETLVSGIGLGRAADEAVAAGTSPMLAQLAQRAAPHSLSGRDVAEAEEAGDPAAHGILEHARRAFASAIVGLVDVFNPSLIVVGGGVALGQGDRLLGPARRLVAAQAFQAPASRVAILPAALGDDVGLAGAIPLVAARLPGVLESNLTSGSTARGGRSSRS
jgi:glucokinase